MTAFTTVETGFVDRIRDISQRDDTYQRLIKEVHDALVKRYWFEDGLLYLKGSRIYDPSGQGLRRELLRENHDSV